MQECEEFDKEVRDDKDDECVDPSGSDPSPESGFGVTGIDFHKMQFGDGGQLSEWPGGRKSHII